MVPRGLALERSVHACTRVCCARQAPRSTSEPATSSSVGMERGHVRKPSADQAPSSRPGVASSRYRDPHHHVLTGNSRTSRGRERGQAPSSNGLREGATRRHDGELDTKVPSGAQEEVAECKVLPSPVDDGATGYAEEKRGPDASESKEIPKMGGDGITRESRESHGAGSKGAAASASSTAEEDKLPAMLESLERVANTIHNLQGRCAHLSWGEYPSFDNLNRDTCLLNARKTRDQLGCDQIQSVENEKCVAAGRRMSSKLKRE